MKMGRDPFYIDSHYSAMELSHKVFSRPDSGIEGLFVITYADGMQWISAFQSGW